MPNLLHDNGIIYLSDYKKKLFYWKQPKMWNNYILDCKSCNPRYEQETDK